MRTPRNGYPSLAVANHLLEMAAAENRELTFPKLQALMYLAHGWHLALTGRPLVNEAFHAWKYSWFKGPLLASMYVEFGKYGPKSPISKKVPGVSLGEASERGYAKRILARIWKLYGERDGMLLVALTRADDTPWDVIARNSNARLDYLRISNDSIKSYFAPRLSMRSERAQARANGGLSWFEKLWSLVTG